MTGNIQQPTREDLIKMERLFAFTSGTPITETYQTTIPRKTNNLLQAGMVQKTWVDKKSGRIHTTTRMQTPAERLDDLQKILYFSGAFSK
jgi:hypothetical protein